MLYIQDYFKKVFQFIKCLTLSFIKFFKIISQFDLFPKKLSVDKLRVDPIKVETNFIATEDELLREFVYRTYLGPNPTQEDYFQLILQKR